MQQATLETYLRVWQAAQMLKQGGRRANLESPPGRLGVVDLLWRMADALREQSGSPTEAWFQPFPAVQALHDDFVGLAIELDECLDQAETSERADAGTNAKLSRQQYRQLQALIDRFEEAFNSTVARHTMFISPERTSLLQYLPLQSYLNETDRSIYNYLPRIAQTYFQDAGKCLAYGLSGAAIGLALQAVEATLRFYFNRHSRETLRDWAPMLGWLRTHNCLPDPQPYCYEVLDRLRKQYRNAVAHGRAYFEAGRQEASEAEAENVFRDCWNAARMLVSETPKRSNLALRIVIHPDLDFDTAVATFLFRWSPELPPFDSDNVTTDAEAAQGELVDFTLNPSVRLNTTAHQCLSLCVRDHLRFQPDYASTLDPLMEFVSARRNGKRRSQFNRDTPREADVDLADLFAGIRLNASNDPYVVLNETWAMLDEFVVSNLGPTGPRLVTGLRQQLAYTALCRGKIVVE